MSSLLLLLIAKHLTEKESYSMKMDLLTKVTVVNDAILFVSGKSKENVKPSSEDDKEESNEPDYYEDQDQLEDSKRVQEK
jgi:ribosomal protein L13